MKTKIAYFATFAFMFLLGCNQKGNLSAQVLDVNSFDQKLHQTTDKILLDVRTVQEYKQGHLENAVLIDVNNKDFKDQINKLDKSKPVFVYCAAGVRSEKAASILKDQGFSKVYHMRGGINEWSDKKKPVVKD